MKITPEARELVIQTKKQLEHLRVLGVENIRLIPVPSAQPKERPLDVKQETRIETFEQIHAEIGDCTRCPLHTGRTHVVHTEGNRKARLMFVGEAPGADEDAQARPFVGRAGQLLTKIIEAIGLKREQVLIGNVNRCRPPGNRASWKDRAAGKQDGKSA